MALDAHNKEDIKISATKFNPVFVLCFDASKRLICMNELYGDDLLRSGNSTFNKLYEITHQKFETTPDEYPPL